MVTVDVVQLAPVQTQKNSAEANLFLLHAYDKKKQPFKTIRFSTANKKIKKYFENV